MVEQWELSFRSCLRCALGFNAQQSCSHSHVVYVCSDACTRNFNACLARISLMLSAWFSFVLRKKNWIRQSIQEKCLCEPIRFYIFLCHKPDSGVQLNEESSYYCSLRSGQPHRLYALSTNQCSEVGWISEVVLLCWPSLSLSLSGLTPTYTALTDRMCCFGLLVIWKPWNKQI